MNKLSLLIFALIVSLKIFPQIPVIFVHQGDSYYLKDSLWQAKQYNDKVILLGDESNKHYGNLVEHYNLCDYFSEAKYFSTIYEHISPNSYKYELFCFQRWFILCKFMHTNNISRCFHCDSDVMIYCDITQEEKNFSTHRIAMILNPIGIYSGGHAFFNIEALDDFCRYLKNYYKCKENIIYWKKWYEAQYPKKYGVSDMILFSEYIKTGIRVANIRTIIDDAQFEYVISCDEEGAYEMQNFDQFKIKVIRWVQGIPYCYNKKLHKWIRFKVFHFHDAKKLMSRFKTPNILSKNIGSLAL